MDENNQNPYGEQNQENAYTTVSTDNNKKDGMGFGIASMVLGIIALLCFCTGLNFILAILAIIFGIIQIVSYKQKGMAIAGLVTAVFSMILFIGLWMYTLSNEEVLEHLMDEYYLEMYDDIYEDDIDEDDIYEMKLPEFQPDYDSNFEYLMDEYYREMYEYIYEDDIDEMKLPEFQPDYDPNVEDSI